MKRITEADLFDGLIDSLLDSNKLSAAEKRAEQLASKSRSILIKALSDSELQQWQSAIECYHQWFQSMIAARDGSWERFQAADQDEKAHMLCNYLRESGFKLEELPGIQGK